MTHTSGIHHITAICGDPVRNFAFYTKILGLRFIKKTVNFDDPGTYHLYYGDEQGSPGTVLTFFPFVGALPGHRGAGESSGTAFAIPPESVSYWLSRLTDMQVPHGMPIKRFGETVIPFSDPDGMTLELVAQPALAGSAGWSNGDVPADHAIRAFAGITIWSARPADTGRALVAMGYKDVASEGDITRWSTGGTGPAVTIDVKNVAGLPGHRSGTGSVHHVAFRAADDAGQAAMADAMRAERIAVTEQRDRCYFRSVYFREPGGTLFEIATDTPGFTVDEPLANARTDTEAATMAGTAPFSHRGRTATALRTALRKPKCTYVACRECSAVRSASPRKGRRNCPLFLPSPLAGEGGLRPDEGRMRGNLDACRTEPNFHEC